MDRRGSVSLSAATYLLGPMRFVVQADSHTVAPMPSNQSVTGFPQQRRDRLSDSTILVWGGHTNSGHDVSLTVPELS